MMMMMMMLMMMFLAWLQAETVKAVNSIPFLQSDHPFKSHFIKQSNAMEMYLHQSETAYISIHPLVGKWVQLRYPKSFRGCLSAWDITTCVKLDENEDMEGPVLKSVTFNSKCTWVSLSDEMPVFLPVDTWQVFWNDTVKKAIIIKLPQQTVALNLDHISKHASNIHSFIIYTCKTQAQYISLLPCHWPSNRLASKVFLADHPGGQFQSHLAWKKSSSSNWCGP